jgi:S-DNA-T family DNA segregation ATPase FtsK/SpoIIIE
MARKKKKKPVISSIFSELKEDTIRGIWGILFLSVALFFTLASLDLAGIAGLTTYHGFTFLFGVGYFLLPVILFIVGISFFRSFEHSFGILKTVSAVIFLIAGLGLIDVIARGEGGMIGSLISAPLIAFLDVYATVLVLFVLGLLSAVIMFDVFPTFGIPAFLKNLFGKNENEDEYEDDEAYEDEEYEEEDAEEEADEAVEDEAEDSPTEESKGFFGIGKKKEVPAEEHFDIVSSFGAEYTPPPLSLLEKDKGKPDVGDVKANANIIKRTLQNFGINVEMDEISIGPTVTRYSLKPAEGVRLSKIVALQNNLELALAAHPVRIEAPIPGKSLVGIEVPNSSKATLGMATLFGSSEFTNSDRPLLVGLGRDITGTSHFADLAKMPHLLIAGATGSGKSVTIHNIIVSLLYRKSPHECRLIMIDPKRVELTLYKNIPHLLTPVITDAKKAILALKWLANEMDRRYNILETESVRDIGSYHKNVVAPALKKKEAGDIEDEDMPEAMPYIVVIIDELADIMQTYPRELEAAIVRLAQMSRAVGIHLILSTQRPSVQVITGLIKANIPTRIALQVSSQIDSRTILDTSGAEKLLGAGDMLYLSGEMSKPRRIQAPYLSEQEVKKVAQYLVKEYENEVPNEVDITAVKSGGSSMFEASLDGDEDDELYEDAYNIVKEAGKASTSYLQRKLRVGYARAARLMDLLEEKGVIGPADGAKPREVIDGGMHSDEDDSYDEDEDDDSEDEALDDASDEDGEDESKR